MKYLRLYKEGFSDEDYFRCVDIDEWWDNRSRSDSKIKMSSGTIGFILRLFSNWNRLVGENLDIIRVDNNNLSEMDYKYSISIYEVDDEYFYVRVYGSGKGYISSVDCYKCDQLEGLEKFLKLYII